MQIYKQLAARLPYRWQTELRRIHYKRQINKGIFVTDEPEYAILHSFLKTGDWVIDIGANVGHYTKRFSELVGKSGRVIAFEPVPTTFSILSANTQMFAHPNVSLINAAVSDKIDVVGMSIPAFSTGLTNYYQAQLSSTSGNDLSVLTMSLDSLGINQRIALVKIDAEGHEAFVLNGMWELINTSRPVLIVETGSQDVIGKLKALGYVPEIMKGSPNVLFKPNPE